MDTVSDAAVQGQVSARAGTLPYRVRPSRLGGAIAIVMAISAANPHGAAARQITPTPIAQETLNRVAADLYSATPHPTRAIEQLKALLATEPALAEGHLLLAIAYRAQGAPELMGEAVAELRQALALKPSLGLARLTLAKVYLDMARASRAREELQIALEQMPGHPQLLAMLGEAERQLGDPRRAVELTRQALATDATLVQARYYLGLALLELRQHADAIRELSLVVQSGANAAEAQFALGTAYLDAGRLDEALAALRESARIDPARPSTHIQLSRAYRSKGLLAAAVKALALARPAQSAGVTTLYQNVDVDFYMEEGLVRMRQGRLTAAAQSFQNVLNLDSGHAQAKQRLAEVRKRLREPTRSKAPGGLS